MNKGRRNFSKAFRYYLMCYGALLCFVVLMVVTVFFGARQALIEDARLITKLELDKCGAEIDRMLASARESSIQMSKNVKLMKLANASEVFDGHEAYSLLEGRNTFLDLWPKTYSFDGGYLVYLTSDRVVTNTSVYRSMATFFDQCVPAGDYDEWMTQLQKRNIENELYSMNGSLIVMNRISFIYPSIKRATLCLYISQTRVDQAMHSEFEGSAYSIVNGGGKTVISSLTPDEQAELDEALTLSTENMFSMKLSGEEVMVTVRRAENCAIKYVSVVPFSSVYAKIKDVERMLAITLSLLVLAGLAVGLALAWKNTRLIRGFVSELTPKDPAETLVDDEFDTISSGIQSLLQNNLYFQHLLVRQKTSLRTAFFLRLFTGAFLNETDMLGAMNEAGIALGGNAFAAAVLQCPSKSMDAKLQVTAVFDEYVYINPTGEDVYSVLLVLADANPLDAGMAAEAVLKVLPKNSLICLGRVCTSLGEIAESYADAKLTYTHAQPGASGVVALRNIDGADGNHLYTYKAEGKLISLVRAGSVDGVKAMLGELLSLTELSKQWDLIRSLSMTCHRIEHEMELPLTSFHLDQCKDSAEAFEGVSGKLIEITEIWHEKEASRSSQLEVKIRNYIMENYLDPAISLTSIADAMDLSESYLSVFFKQKAGENISAYIERLRVDRAYRLLTETDMSISEVAHQSGYQSDQTFRRAFKKLMGCAPSQMRQA